MKSSESENMYPEDEILLLSGIQHMAFCERQWALIHIEQVWAENAHTVEGNHLHERTDNPFGDERRKMLQIIRAMPVVTRKLGLRGIADVVEFHQYNEKDFIEGKTCRIKNKTGWWQPIPVEYKKGRPKKDDRDAVQLCAQAIALEEMMQISIDFGFLFYFQTKRREQISLDGKLRQHTMNLATRMHQLADEGKTPKAQKGKHCSQCSLLEQCQPYWMLRHRSVAAYLIQMCFEEEDNFCDDF